MPRRLPRCGLDRILSRSFYLLPGIDGGDNLDPGGNFAPGSKSWFGFTDLQGFFGNKNVNVVSPLGGAFSWYTNWVNDGSKQYQTYMTQELPPLINAQYKTNGRNAVAGLSSTGGTAVDYAIQAPGLYRAVGSYSGFLTPSTGAQNIALTLTGGGANADDMWGPQGGPLWVAHDPTVNVARLKGTAVFVTASGGGQGDVDKLPPAPTTSPADSSRASSTTAPSSSRTPLRPPVCRSSTSSDPRVPTRGGCSSRRCRFPGTPPSGQRSGSSPSRHRPAGGRVIGDVARRPL
ncbi:MAG: esterase family protein [Mycobacterium sp.]|nr:esterase family protein [Mycobacterium sp.]